jgi:hypothetical protein
MGNDCNRIINDVENVFDNLGNCLEDTFDARKSKVSVAKSLFRFGGSLTKLAFDTTACAVKNTPKAVVAVASVKREIITAIEEEVHEYQKQQKIDALDDQIKQIKMKKKV